MSPAVANACAILAAWLPGEQHRKAADTLLLEIRQGKIEPHGPLQQTTQGFPRQSPVVKDVACVQDQIAAEAIDLRHGFA
ncbi:MAG: hypothetical protein AB1714_22285 [Acidobacteriota bacterium]